MLLFHVSATDPENPVTSRVKRVPFNSYKASLDPASVCDNKLIYGRTLDSFRRRVIHLNIKLEISNHDLNLQDLEVDTELIHSPVASDLSNHISRIKSFTIWLFSSLLMGLALGWWTLMY